MSEWTKEIIENEKRLAEKATPRPWWRGEHPGTMADAQKFMSDAAAYQPDSQMLYMLGSGPRPESLVDEGKEPRILPAITGNGPTSEANRDFICQAVNNYIPALEEIERLQCYLTEKKAEPMSELVTWLTEKLEWSYKTFGSSERHLGVLKHIEKEVEETRENPKDITEWIDIILLAFDGACRMGFTPRQVVDALISKQEINTRRIWGPIPKDDEPSFHISFPKDE